uniref:DUF5672 domain-containing protein n=1 Tax=viral metagenome TaxID=1070528 RepID=A0A6C0BAE1_9ZZZZ
MSKNNSEILMFDWECYYNAHKEKIIEDLEIDIKNRDIAWYHWTRYGKKINLKYYELKEPETIFHINPHDTNPEYMLFNIEEYLSSNPDLQVDIKTKEEGWNHWIKYGKNEGRTFCSLENKNNVVIESNLEDEYEEEEYEQEEYEEEEYEEEEYEEEEKKPEKKPEPEPEYESEPEYEEKKIESSHNKKNSKKDYQNFNWQTYVNNYADLSHFTKKMEAWKHWIKNGKYEGRTFLKLETIRDAEVPLDVSNDHEYIHFDWEKYIQKYNDLRKITTKAGAWHHWINNGKMESRTYFSIEKIQKTKEEYSNIIPMHHYLQYENSFYQEYNHFDWQTYISNYDDIGEITNKEDAFQHWFFQGKAEGRTFVDILEISKKNDKIMKIEILNSNCKIENNEIDTIIINDTKENMETEEEEEEEEEENIPESNPIIKKDITFHKNVMKKTLELKHLYERGIENFMIEYNISDKNSIYADPKVEFRYFCFKYLNYMRNCCTLPKIELYKSKEAVFIEFREFAHSEFLIRNAIMKLGSSWSFTVICGSVNYKFMISLCKKISKNITIIKLQKNIESVQEYSELLKTKNFWNYMKGDKILLYQEDSFIFSNKINEFLEYDYIGAPWYRNFLNINVGNGGLSLRTRQSMIDVIDALEEENIDTDESIPEDIFFSKYMQHFQIGTIADWDTASQFSSEIIYNKDSFGGHQFWLSDPWWKDRMYESIYKYSSLLHPYIFS